MHELVNTRFQCPALPVGPCSVRVWKNPNKSIPGMCSMPVLHKPSSIDLLVSVSDRKQQTLERFWPVPYQGQICREPATSLPQNWVDRLRNGCATSHFSPYDATRCYLFSMGAGFWSSVWGVGGLSVAVLIGVKR